MQGWTNFYLMIGGAASTLLGLLFVSISLNAETILGPTHQHSKRLAEQAFQNYLCVIMIALLVFFPGAGPIDLGYSVLWMTGIWGLWVVWRIVQVFTAPGGAESRVRILRRYIPTSLGFATLIYSGVHSVLRQGDYTIFVAIGVMLLLISATIVSWELLVRVAEEKYGTRKT